MVNLVLETCWVQNLLLEISYPLSKATLVYGDNAKAIYLLDKPVQHQQTKHIKMDIDFVSEKVNKSKVRVIHVPYRYQIADIFTKGLPQILFDDFLFSLIVLEPPHTL